MGFTQRREKIEKVKFNINHKDGKFPFFSLVRYMLREENYNLVKEENS